jgi:GNAT superfamily N-acetyltransferase
VSPEVVLRQADEADAEGFVRAYESSWDATLAPIVGKSLGELMPFETRVENYLESLEAVSEHARVWVAERAGEIVGLAVAVRDSPQSVELRSLYVVPEAWGSGVSAKLMVAAIESVRGDATEAVLWVGEDNTRARRFYEREGWVLDEATRASPLGPGEVRYRLPLEPQPERHMK